MKNVQNLVPNMLKGKLEEFLRTFLGI